MEQILHHEYSGKAEIYTFVWRKTVEKNLAKVKEQAKQMFHEYGGKGNLTRAKLRELADKQVPSGRQFAHGIGRCRAQWQK